VRSLRWLVDRNTDALITRLDDLITLITIHALDSPTATTPIVGHASSTVEVPVWSPEPHRRT